jgi:hypothetical protein
MPNAELARHPWLITDNHEVVAVFEKAEPHGFRIFT